MIEGEGVALKFTAGGQRASRGNCPNNNTRKLAKNTLKIKRKDAKKNLKNE